MKTNLKKWYPCLALLIFTLLATALSGCAGSQHRGISKPREPFFSKQDQSDLAEDPVLDQKLPEMTAEEREALGDRHFNAKDYYLAYLQYGKALQLNPDNVRLQYKQGMLFLASAKYKDAAGAFTGVIVKEPANAAAHEGLGTALFEMQAYDRAIPHFSKTLALNPGSWKARNFLGNIYDFQKQYDLAVREYSEAILLKPENAMLYNNLGVSLSLAGRYEESIKAFKQALSADGQKQKVFNNLGMVLARTGRYDAALEAFKHGSDKARAYNNLGCVLMAQGEYRKAAQAFNKAIAASPKFYEKAYDNLKKVELGRVQ